MNFISKKTKAIHVNLSENVEESVEFNLKRLCLSVLSNGIKLELTENT